MPGVMGSLSDLPRLARVGWESEPGRVMVPLKREGRNVAGTDDR